MANSLAIFQAQRALQGGTAIADAYGQKLMAEMQADAIALQMDEIQRRTDVQIGQTFRKGEEIQAAQTAAFIQGGVEIEGTPMEVLSDTIAEAAQEAYLIQSEADYRLQGLAREEAAAKFNASDSQFLLKAFAGSANAYAGYMQDQYAVGRMRSPNRGARGIA